MTRKLQPSHGHWGYFCEGLSSLCVAFHSRESVGYLTNNPPITKARPGLGSPAIGRTCQELLAIYHPKDTHFNMCHVTTNKMWWTPAISYQPGQTAFKA